MKKEYETYEDVDSPSTASLVLMKLMHKKDDAKIYEFIEKWAINIYPDCIKMNLNLNKQMIFTLKCFVNKKKWREFKKENRKYFNYIENYKMPS